MKYILIILLAVSIFLNIMFWLDSRPKDDFTEFSIKLYEINKLINK